jgi:para-aminobenzoate synthetase/4-amino-4-deoxychorismate lyase
VIEARFDDLTGASPSFRLTGPVGIIEATRADEVAAAIEAAEAAATRGLWVGGFVAYEAAPGLDRSLTVRTRQAGDPFERLPLAWFAMFERREETSLPQPRDDPPPAGGPWEATTDRRTYDRGVERIREHIAAGDSYQVNYTIRLRSMVRGDERGLYRDLCFAQRGPHAAYLNAGRYRILSASPELFVRLEGDRITTRPMKGTAPRGRWPAEDERLGEALVGSSKDRAENAMIVDLLRNDLGRVARTGSVSWDRVFEAERYETVWQLTSTVAADLAPGTRFVDVFRALFPSGSVTGAPKVRSMEIIAGLEGAPRGAYCGAVGWIGPNGSEGRRASFNVAIRTVTVDAETGIAEYGVGGGITYDSSATAEYDEVLAKARVLADRRPAFDLIETMRRDPGGAVWRLEEHLVRLRGSAAFFGFTFDEADTRHAIDQAGVGVDVDVDQPIRLRVVLARNGRVRVTAARLDDGSAEPVRVAVDDRPVDPTDVFLFHKTTMRSRYEEATARHPDADDVILVNDRGEITEASSSNVAVRLDGRWWTPPLDAGLLPGTERAALLAAGTVAERPIGLADLERAEGIAVFNSVRGWRRAVVTS